MPKNVFERAVKERVIFKDEAFLYPEFVPERLPHREKEIDALVFAFDPVLKGKRPQNVFLAGPTGCGKTAVAKFVLKELEEFTDRAKSVYINCFEYNSRHSVLSKITNFIGAPAPRRGIATDEIYSQFLDAMKRIDFTPIIVLDEVDQLVFSEDGSKLLYDILRVHEQEKTVLGLGLISNNSELTLLLDSRIRSSLTEERILFEGYTPEQLKDILFSRAQYAFASGALSEEVIGVAAANAARLGGDARVAIESLLKAGREAERENSEKVLLKHLKKAFESVDAVSLLKGLKHLNENEKLLLGEIAQADGITSGQVFEAFKKKSKSPLTERRLRDLLNGLEKRDFVSSEQLSLGNKGKTRKYHCRLPQKMVLKELSSN
ncbi:MAG: AAA family ATPase [Candidatus Diapherotrites archaeon]|nr:AAA family ATPase [Candidatus Diapherotrites archaeon]